jgi:predicted transcriptional regulator YdeE
MASLATIPYGQYKKGELKDDDLARVGAFWKKYWSESLKEKDPKAARYPSFENWAAMMSYDRDTRY